MFSYCHNNSGGSRISPRGVQPSGGAATYDFAKLYPKTAWNWKNLDPGRGVPRELLDQLLNNEVIIV